MDIIVGSLRAARGEGQCCARRPRGGRERDGNERHRGLSRAGGEAVKTALAGAKLSTYTEVNLGAKPNKGKLLGSLKRRVGVDTPVLIVAGQVFDKKRIEYLCKQDMMLPVFRAAGTSGEVRLPFQDLRFYLSKTIR